jgi:hypothetical protein
MGSNVLVAAITLLLQTSPTDSSTALTRTLQDQYDSTSTKPQAGFAYERLPDLLQYNRVQGLSLGVGYRLPFPGLSLAAVYGTVRYGFSDERITGRLSLVREWAQSRLLISGYHDVIDLDPFSPGRTVSNTLNGIFVGHDHADYALSDGGLASVELTIAPALRLGLSARLEHQHNAPRTAQSEVNDFLGGSGLFPPNPAIMEGVFGNVIGRLAGAGRARWSLTLDLMGGGGQATTRLYGDLGTAVGRNREVTLRIKAGAGTSPALPQTLFRVGGLNTVRGFEYATLRSTAFWAAQLDLAPIKGRVRPVAFLDVGQGGSSGDLSSTEFLVGGGIGVMLFNGLMRLHFSRPISPKTASKVRFDLVLQGVR